MKTAIIFFFAVLSEVTATTALKFSEGFTKLIPSVVVVLGYGLSFYLLSLTLKVMPIGTAYAMWSGIGIVLTVIAGIVLWRESMDWARGIGIFSDPGGNFDHQPVFKIRGALINVSFSLTSHKRFARSSSYDRGEDGMASRLTKYLPVTPRLPALKPDRWCYQRLVRV